MAEFDLFTLNFLPVNSEFEVECYFRRRATSIEPRPFDGAYLSDVDLGDGRGKTACWLSMEAKPGFESVRFLSSHNPPAGTWALQRSCAAMLAEHCKERGCLVEVRGGFRHHVDIRVVEHEIGWQGFKCEFCWISELRKHCMLVRFHFFKNDGVGSTVDVQKLSLGLGASGAPNKDFYADVRQWLVNFRETVLNGFTFRVSAGGPPLRFVDFATLPAHSLGGRTYEFASGSGGQKPYFGIRRFGPFRTVGKTPTYVFVFPERYKSLARFLFTSLAGKEFPEKFAGMERYFRVPFSVANVKHVQIAEYSWREYERVVREIKANAWENPVCIVVMPGDSAEYYLQKTVFLNAGIPSQDVRVDRLANKGMFQWCIAGVALQLFCKSGGIPWCIRSGSKNSLIVGVSQLWEDDERGRRRHVAYSVLTDASGLFKEIKTLANTDRSDDYVPLLVGKLREQLVEWNGKERPERIVLHCSFRLRKDAMDGIRTTVAELMQDAEMPRIFVLRVDTNHPYFGFDPRTAACVPRENTYVRLSRSQFILWTDGATPEGPIRTRPSYPLHVIVDRSDEPITDAEERELLEDLANLAGANWRGFNAKAKPTSVNYCQLVGDFIHELTSYESEYVNVKKYDFRLPKLELLAPWFL